MPHDLFGDVLVRPSARSRRVAALSVIAHGAVLLALLVVPLLAVDVLPIPQRAVAFFIQPDAVIPIVPPPPAPVRTSEPPRVVQPPGVPLVAPTGIASEPPRPTASENAGSSVVGVVEGVGSDDVAGMVTGPPPPPPPPTQAPIRLHSGIRAPARIVNVAPIYPTVAREARIQGVVILEATIDARGNVEAARVLRSVPLLDQAALEAVSQWKYTPALLNGVPVPVIMTITVKFTLQER